jgi:diacylglycerol kinase
MIKKIQKHIASQENAWRGLRDMVMTQQNFNIELFAAVLVIAAGIIFGISPTEWALVIICITSVLAAESINTSIEKACDAITLEYNEYIRAAKDMGATAVLIIAAGSVIIGGMIFLPKLIGLL